jgi:hypothetical protein
LKPAQIDTLIAGYLTRETIELAFIAALRAGAVPGVRAAGHGAGHAAGRRGVNTFPPHRRHNTGRNP